MIMSEVRVALSTLRAQRGLSQRQLAALAGLRPDTVSALERGTSAGIRFDTLARLCEVLECDPGELFEINLDEHHVPTLGGPEEDNLIRDRLRDDQARIDGPSFLAELLKESRKRSSRAGAAG
jgi:putative transcriptional regulator